MPKVKGNITLFVSIAAGIKLPDCRWFWSLVIMYPWVYWFVRLFIPMWAFPLKHMVSYPLLMSKTTSNWSMVWSLKTPFWYYAQINFARFMPLAHNIPQIHTNHKLTMIWQLAISAWGLVAKLSSHWFTNL